MIDDLVYDHMGLQRYRSDGVWKLILDDWLLLMMEVTNYRLMKYS